MQELHRCILFQKGYFSFAIYVNNQIIWRTHAHVCKMELKYSFGQFQKIIINIIFHEK